MSLQSPSSLVLGTVDRPSLHDLVLDFAVAQHTAEELRENHHKVVEAFRTARPADFFGRRKFDKSLTVDPMCAYVCNEIDYHVGQAGTADSDTAVAWLQDAPIDSIVIAAGHATGVKKLLALAEAAESSTDWWLAARYWALLQVVTLSIEGLGAARAPNTKALDAIEKMLATGDHPTQTTDALRDDVDEILMQQLNFYLQSFPEEDFRVNLIAHVEASTTRKRYPADATTISFSQAPILFATGKLLECGELLYKLFSSLAESARTHPDPASGYKCLMQVTICNECLLSICVELCLTSTRAVGWQAYNFPFSYGTMMLSSDFDFDCFFGARGGTAIQASEQYCYERTHASLIGDFYFDAVLWGAGHSWPLLMHWVRDPFHRHRVPA